MKVFQKGFYLGWNCKNYVEIVVEAKLLVFIMLSACDPPIDTCAAIDMFLAKKLSEMTSNEIIRIHSLKINT